MECESKHATLICVTPSGSLLICLHKKRTQPKLDPDFNFLVSCFYESLLGCFKVLTQNGSQRIQGLFELSL